MMNKLSAYIIVFDEATLTTRADQLHRYITENKFAERWWNNLPLVYVIASRMEHDVIWRSIEKFLGEGNSFIVAKIDPDKTDGSLPVGAWTGFVEDIEEYISPVVDDE